MKKTISINIAGLVFNIEEYAYQILEEYLNAIKSNFQNETERDEIMEDVEIRIAEIFESKLSSRKEVVTEVDITDVIEVMGKPEQYLTDESEEGITFENKNEQSYSKSNHKRLYRDESEGKLGGVCSGLGYYFGLDPVLIRILFVLLTIFGAGILLYIVLWVVMPSASTTSQILEMKGQNVTVENIKEHVKDVKNSIVDSAKKSKPNLKKAVNSGVKVTSQIGKVIGKILGVGFIVGSTFGVLIVLLLLFSDFGFFPLFNSENIEDLPTLLGVIYPDGKTNLLLVSLSLAVLIPISFFMYLGVRLLFNTRVKLKKTGILLVVFWLLSIGVLVVINLDLGMSFRERKNVEYVVTQDDIANHDTLYVDVLTDDVFSEYLEFNKVWNPSQLVKIDDEKVYLGYPNLEVTHLNVNDSSDFNVILHKESNGFSNKDAIQRAEKIEYKLSFTNNKLMLSPYFMINAADKFKGQLITIEIQVPKGKVLSLGENIDRILVDVEDYWQGDSYSKTTWQLDEFGELRCKGCEDFDRYYYY